MSVSLVTPPIPTSWMQGEQTWRMEDILNAIEKDGDTIALVIFSGEE